MIYEICILSILLLPAAGSLVSLMLGKRNEDLRNLVNIIITAALLVLVTLLYKPVSNMALELFIPDIMGTGLYLKLDLLRYVFVWITAFIWFLATVYSTAYLKNYKNRNRYFAISLLTLSTTIGIFLSEHLLNLFTFFEVMSLTSYILVIHDEDEHCLEAGKSYLTMAIAGGMIMLMGLFLLYDYTDTLLISQLPRQIELLGNIKYLIGVLLIIGFGVKASMFPLHTWLPKAYTAAPTPVTAILSAILAKTGIFGILITVVILMKGSLPISVLVMVSGLLNMFIGGFLAMFQRNIKRILAYSSMSQMGYILMGVGLIGILGQHNSTAVYGTIYHVVNHALFKGLLFLGAGMIFMLIGDLSINSARGLGKHMLLLKILFLTGIFATVGMPGFNGFAGKTLLHEALLEARHLYNTGWLLTAEVIFVISSSFTTAYLLKIFAAVFMEDNEKFNTQFFEVNKIPSLKRIIAPLIVLCGTIVFIGINPDVFIKMIDGGFISFGVHDPLHIEFFTFHNVKSVMFSIIAGIIIYVLFIKRYLKKKNENGVWYINPSLSWFNLDKHFYLPVFNSILKAGSYVLSVLDQSMINLYNAIAASFTTFINLEIKTFSRIRSRIESIYESIINEDRPQRRNPMLRHKSLEGLFYNTNSKSQEVVKTINTMRVNLNSITNSVFIFALILAAVLMILVVTGKKV